MQKIFFSGCAKKLKFWHQCSTLFNSCVVKASYRVQRWTGQFCDLVIKHRLELYKSILRQHTFYRNWSLWDRGLIYCIYYWKEESVRKRVLAFPFACRQIDQICDYSRGGWFLSICECLYLITVYLTTCHRNWLGLLKPGKWNDFETKWNTSTNKHRHK